MQRRKLIRFSALALCGSAIAAIAADSLRARDYVSRSVRRQLPYVSVDADALAKFGADYRKYASTRLLTVLNTLSLFASFYALAELAGFRTEKRALDEHIARVFLLSSDFFRNKAEPQSAAAAMPVRYLSFYDPRHFGCQNPFAELY